LPRTRLRPQCRHRDVVGIDVLQNVGVQRERDQPRTTTPGVRIALAGGSMRLAVLGLVVEFDRVRDEGL
jgi:hypothetical protein